MAYKGVDYLSKCTYSLQFKGKDHYLWTEQGLFWPNKKNHFQTLHITDKLYYVETSKLLTIENNWKEDENYLLESIIGGISYWHRSNVSNDFKRITSKIIMFQLYGNNPEEKLNRNK